MTEISQTLERKTDREGKQTRQSDRQTGREKINPIDRQMVRKTHRQIDRQSRTTDEDRRANRQTDKRSYEWKV